MLPLRMYPSMGKEVSMAVAVGTVGLIVWVSRRGSRRHTMLHSPTNFFFSYDKHHVDTLLGDDRTLLTFSYTLVFHDGHLRVMRVRSAVRIFQI